jgi:hypothetical protein
MDDDYKNTIFALIWFRNTLQSAGDRPFTSISSHNAWIALVFSLNTFSFPQEFNPLKQSFLSCGVIAHVDAINHAQALAAGINKRNSSLVD